MMTRLDLSKAPKGATHFAPGGKDFHDCWAKKSGKAWLFLRVGDETGTWAIDECCDFLSFIEINSNYEHGKTITQCDRALDALRKGPITGADAWQELGIIHLSSRITDLKNKGHNITKEMVEVTNRFGEKVRIARYSLHE